MFDQKDVLSITKIFDSGTCSDLTVDFLNKLSSETLIRFRVKPLNRVRNVLRILKRILKPTGLVVAFYGCDGSGKSTLIDKLIAETKDLQVFRSVAYHHLYPQKKSAKKNTAVSNPHEQKNRSKLESNLKLLYFFFLYFIGYWRTIYPQKIKSNLVIFDRYYFDILVDPKRYRHNGSEWLTKLIGWAIPKPDISIVIDADPKVLQSRKQEVSFDESKRQREKYLELNSIIENVTIVDNNDNVEKAYFEIKSTIVTECIKRYNKRN
jgi:thymidylate kinase